ncbi:MAG: type III pantothenate kinase [gamma proteobacterium symbiont of Bathyaustriella thionipta]|nr:type III pantothenate kinase [gamma proteobacterium symbiont of Bathyaustriella thionipta]MCU7950598.1 type III pantothenate kinase [gamma proteobacterium symbiont of Bathyaustriella thionipta]MCU7954734.1 type III pantothenate kinase [gamma proteobacterium symbiont of Bathyaustriella thionipta]MCU7957106.1 type III pantothenate kinase [gamma proteobacterium symbiont of Bathyaustriella thionipta]MCU7968990.1 type III pantothenate kinase [gamma proteobacterium symbiont of Bathyaustriella thio
MSYILIDAGNSCLKISIVNDLDDPELSYYVLNYANLYDELYDFLQDCIPSDVIVSNVNNITIYNIISDSIFKLWRIQPHLVTVEQDKYGMSTRYTNPRTLGCDRWLALIAARNESKKTLCVIDCGTAVTIDVLSNKGMHLGGLISPGISTSRRVLGLTANNLPIVENRDENINNKSSFLAINTQDAILGGTLYQISAYIERIITEFKQEFGNNTDCIITGGDAELILSLTGHHLQYRETLVLDGLRLAAKEIFDREST